MKEDKEVKRINACATNAGDLKERMRNIFVLIVVSHTIRMKILAIRQ